MTIHPYEPHSNKKKSHKKSPWVLWIVVSVVILAVVVYTIVAFLILSDQDSAQGISALTIISVIIGVVIGLPGLMLSFLQWNHPKASEVPEASKFPHTLPQLMPSVVLVTESSSSIERQLAFTQTTSPGTINSVLSPAITTNSPDKQSNNDLDQLAAISSKEERREAPYAKQFYGRDKEPAKLEQWIEGDHCQMVALLGIGVIGKTSLVAKLTERIKDKFEYVTWRSLQNALQRGMRNALSK